MKVSTYCSYVSQPTPNVSVAEIVILSGLARRTARRFEESIAISYDRKVVDADVCPASVLERHAGRGLNRNLAAGPLARGAVAAGLVGRVDAARPKGEEGRAAAPAKDLEVVAAMVILFGLARLTAQQIEKASLFYFGHDAVGSLSNCAQPSL